MIQKQKNKLETIGATTNGGQTVIQSSLPYRVELELQGSSDLLFHRWNDDGVAAKAAAAKGSTAKKTDDIESYVYRNDSGCLAIPGEYLRSSIVIAAKFRQDPRSPRKSAMDLFKAGVVSMTLLADLGLKNWDYLDRRRVIIQRNAITRIRPAVQTGWKARFVLSVLVPEYINPELLKEVVDLAGRLVGVGDFRPTFGRFSVVNWKLLSV
jgi:hypothetical protein